MGVRSVPVVIADLVQRAELTPLKGRGPEVVHDPHTSSLSESTNPNGLHYFRHLCQIPLSDQESCSSIRVRRAHCLTRDNLVARQATFALSMISQNRRSWALRFRQAM